MALLRPWPATAASNSQAIGGPANLAGIYGPYALFLDAGGNLWLTDTFHNRVREIIGSFLGFTYSTIKVGNVSPPQTGALYNQGNANLVLSAPVLNQAALASSDHYLQSIGRPDTRGLLHHGD